MSGSTGGGLTQIVAYGAQDVYLTGDASQSLWKTSYVRKKLFAVESVEQTIQGTTTYGGTGSVVIQRAGDIACGMMFQITLRRGPSGTNDPIPFFPAEHLIQNIELRIGGQRIDWIPHNWLRVYAQMYFNSKQTAAYTDMADFGNEVQGQERTFFIPIPFFFNHWDFKRALPLIALQYHDVELWINFTNASDIVGIDPTFEPKIRLYVDYAYLDSEERVWFAQNPHEYLIQQLQYQKQTVIIDALQRDYKFSVNFNHPSKFLAWNFAPGTETHGRFTYLEGETDDNTAAPLAQAVITLNGRERFTMRPGKYFKNANPWLSQYGGYFTSGLYAYNFGLNNCLNADPAGTLNFSRIDNAILRLITKQAVLTGSETTTTENQTNVQNTVLNLVEIYALNYNILRIQSGMGGLAYAN
ncbi:major capsid protein VP54 [Acanthocystis turfacea Chlorella virus TN603.4.2]|nr:major capsid protein VP54 [Acanthocystis turfacea Chlorella virus TN603.4.2]